MVDHVKISEEVNRHGLCAVWLTGLVGTLGYITCERKESGNGGVVGTETMLRG